jgi:hypothetical protein
MPAPAISPAVYGLSAVAGIAGFSAGRKAANAARREAQRQAAEIELQRFQVREIATQQHLSRTDQYSQTVAQNRAAAAYMGRSDRSIEALRRREATLYGRDVERIRSQEEQEVANLYSQATATRAAGLAQSKAIKAQTYGSLLNTAITVASIGS